MGPNTVREFERAGPATQLAIASAMHLNPSLRLWETLGDLAKAGWSELGDGIEGLIPSPNVIVDVGLASYLFQTEEDCLTLTVLQWDSKFRVRTRDPAPKLEAGGRVEELNMADQRRAIGVAATAIYKADLLFSLMNEPRLVVKAPPPRQQLRQAERKLGGDVPAAWYQLKWTIGEETASRADSGDGSYRLPLHHCRAHWMWVGHESENAEWRHGRRGPGWYTWRGHSWKGHPDFGIKLTRYAPEIDADGQSAAVISAVRQQATMAAQQAAIAAWQAQGRH